MDQLFQALDYLGITPKQLVPALVVGSFFLYIVNKFFLQELKDNFKMVEAEGRDLHNATREIQFHLVLDGFTPQHSLEQKPLFEQYGKHASPMLPNEKGAKLLEDSHFFEMYHGLQDDIFSQMDKMNLRTLYDYESGASRALFLLANSPEMDSVKEYVVNHPDDKLELIFGIASWVIRDDYAKYKRDKNDKELPEAGK